MHTIIENVHSLANSDRLMLLDGAGVCGSNTCCSHNQTPASLVLFTEAMTRVRTRPLRLKVYPGLSGHLPEEVQPPCMMGFFAVFTKRTTSVMSTSKVQVSVRVDPMTGFCLLGSRTGAASERHS